MEAKNINILIACEESQAVCIEFRKLGFNAFSCDLLPCSAGKVEWHFQRDITDILRTGIFQTQGGASHWIKKWDLIIAFPPCTDLSASGARHFERKRLNGAQERSIAFFMMFALNNCSRVAIENPIGIMSSEFRKPNQIIQPWQFGDKAQKSTCLWLKGIPELKHTNIVEKGEFFEWVEKKSGKIKKQPLWYYQALLNSKTPEQRRTLRSKTFPGIAKAMAEQWGNYILNN